MFADGETFLLEDPKEIALKLTADQRKCILDLSAEWKEIGYSKVHADILWALGGSDLHRTFPALVDCTFHREPGISPNYRHRLLPLGVEVKQMLIEMVEH